MSQPVSSSLARFVIEDIPLSPPPSPPPVGRMIARQSVVHVTNPTSLDEIISSMMGSSMMRRTFAAEPQVPEQLNMIVIPGAMRDVSVLQGSYEENWYLSRTPDVVWVSKRKEYLEAQAVASRN